MDEVRLPEWSLARQLLDALEPAHRLPVLAEAQEHRRDPRGPTVVAAGRLVVGAESLEARQERRERVLVAGRERAQPVLGQELALEELDHAATHLGREVLRHRAA